MYQAGDRVVYGMHGVCSVVTLEERTVDRKRITYLVLEPVGQHGSRYLVPAHNAGAMAKLRPMLTVEELKQLLASDEVRSDSWILDENQRKQTYRELIGSGDRVKLMGMVRNLYRHRETQSAAGKKVHLCDDNFLRDAERVLASEIALVMETDLESAKNYLREQLKTG